MRTFAAAAVALFAFAIPARAEMPKPLGVPLGTSVEDVQKALPHTRLEKTGISAITNGLILETDGTGLDVEGLRHVVLVFDADKRLDAVQMRMDKDAYDRVFGYLRKLYPLKSNQAPFVGDRKAVFADQGWRIELAAPHTSFDATATYMTKPFFAALERNTAVERQEKAQKEGARF